MPATTVFVSYASEDAYWKENFTDTAWFSNLLGNNVKVQDYMMADNLPFGRLNQWLEDEINSTAAIVLIVSKNYIDKKYTLREWWLGLTPQNAQRLVFVPVMIDASAKAWWTEQKQLGKLSVLGDDFQYANFSEGGKPVEIVGKQGRPITLITQRISEVARFIRFHLEKRRVDEHAGGGSAAGALEYVTGEVSSEAATSFAEPLNPVTPNMLAASRCAGSATRYTIEEERFNITVLGHPSAQANPEVTRNVDKLMEALTAANLAPFRWKDGWRAASVRPGPSTLSQRDIFVQPLGPMDAGDYSDDSLGLRKWIQIAVSDNPLPGMMVLSSFKLVLWLPSTLTDKRFEAALKNEYPTEGLVLRHDDPFTLATWLKAQIVGAELPNVTVLELEDFVDVAESRKLRDTLHEKFFQIVGEIVNPVEIWPFSGEMLLDHLKSPLVTDRVIIAVHDLNTGTARQGHEARRQLEEKLSAIEDFARSAGRTDLKFFRSALLVAKADTLPFVKYPHPSQFENWCCLPFAENGGTIEPKAIYADVFRTYLRDWVDAAA